jgi:anti-sigma factor RsiW
MNRLFGRHVVDDLAAYEEGELDLARAARTNAHLARCKSCRAALEDVRHARRLLEALPPLAMPSDQVARLNARLLRRPSAAWRVPSLAVTAAVVLLIGVALVLRYSLRAGPDFVRASGPMGLEALAGELHDRLRNGTQKLDLLSSDAARVRAWQLERGAPETRLAAHMTRAGWPDVRLRGASVVLAGRGRVSLVAYEVDEHPVTLLTAAQMEVPSAPSSAWFSKRVHFRTNASGHPALTWSTSGQTYTLVSDLPGVGEPACLACHTTPEFKLALERAASRILDSGRP